MSPELLLSWCLFTAFFTFFGYSIVMGEKVLIKWAAKYLYYRINLIAVLTILTFFLWPLELIALILLMFFLFAIYPAYEEIRSWKLFKPIEGE